MSTRVFYSSWQIQCCGDPFSVGRDVSWTAIPAEPGLGEDLGTEGDGIEWLEEHHQEEGTTVIPIAGRVTGIRAIWQKFEQPDPQRKMLYPVAGAVLARELDSADGWESERVGPEPDYMFTGYLVTLDPKATAPR